MSTAPLDWLLTGDPSIRWQVMDDLLGLPRECVAAERARVATEGRGARLLAEQDPEWSWAGVRLLLERARRFDGGHTLAATVSGPEMCITGMPIDLAVAFGLRDSRVDDTVEWLTAQQLADGGWTCPAIRRGSGHGSFHTSITALEAMAADARSGGSVPVAEATVAGREFFLDHHLDRSHHTGEVVDRSFARFPFPSQWHFDVVRGLEHVCAVGAVGAARLTEAIEEVRRAQRPDGTWPRHRPYPGRYWFTMEAPGPSRWSTLRALRVLAWWDGREQT